ncbi:hypothetical protein BCR42DRAFT_413551, partial [Absidia repens]
ATNKCDVVKSSTTTTKEIINMDERTINQIKHYLKKLQYSEDATDREKRYLTLHYYNKRYIHISVLTFILVLTFYLTLHYFEIEILSYLNTEQQTTNKTKIINQFLKMRYDWRT